MKKHRFYYRDKISICMKDIFIKMILKSLKHNLFFSKSFRQRIMNKLTMMNMPFNINKLKKFCISTGRLRFIINNTKFSRIMFRNYTSFGFMTGFYKNA